MIHAVKPHFAKPHNTKDVAMALLQDWRSSVPRYAEENLARNKAFAGGNLVSAQHLVFIPTALTVISITRLDIADLGISFSKLGASCSGVQVFNFRETLGKAAGLWP